MTPTPIYDDFIQAFIITRGDLSFYLDLDGNYNKQYRSIKWPSRVEKIYLAAPYLVAILSNDEIQVRNILNPELILRSYRLDNCQFSFCCVA